MPDSLERWWADGLELTEGGNRDVESYEGLFTSPTLLATDISVAQRDGELPGVARLSPGGFTLNIWLGRKDRSSVERDWEHLLRVMMKRHRLVRWERLRPDGTRRACWGRIVGRIAPTPIGRLGIRAQVEVTIPSGTWEDTAVSDTGGVPILSAGPLIPVNWVDPRGAGQQLKEDEVPTQGPAGPLVSYNGDDGSATYADGWVFDAEDHIFRRGTVPTSGPMDRYVQLAQFAGSSAPMTKLEVQLTGPFPDGVMLQTPETGTWAKYDLPLSASESIVIDGANDTVFAPRVDAFRYKGPYMVEAVPNDRFPAVHGPLLRVIATQTGTGASIRVQGRRLYLTM